MSIDRYYNKVDGEWVRVDPEEPSTKFWVDICHGKNMLVDERYYFPDLKLARSFYVEGWKDRQFVDDHGSENGLDHSGLYSNGRLIQGQSIHGDQPSRVG